MKKTVVVVIAASVLLSWRTHAQSPASDAETVIKAITTAMGTSQLRSLQYTGTGSIYSTGQAYQAGGAWPRYTLTKYAMSVDYSVPATSTPATPAAAPRAEPPQPLKLANGVWALTPAIEGSILVEFNDYLVMIESPANDAYGLAAMESARKLVPNRPIKYLINTHHHADHAGAMRAYVAEGIPIITHESHRKYYEDVIFKNPHSLNPDRLARMPRTAMIETIKDKRVFTDGNQTLEILLMRGQQHAEGMLMAYLPKDKILIQADAYVPRPGAPPLPARSPHMVNLVDNVSRLKLDVERVVHIHGGSSPYSDVLAAVGRPRSTN